MSDTLYTLSPADVADLRTSMRRAIPLDTASIGQFSAPSIIYLPADDSFGLVHHSRMVACTPRIELLAACLRCERAERGFIDRILDAATDVRMASLDPHSAMLERQRAAAERAKAAAYTAEADAASTRRQTILRPSTDALTLDDLL